MKSLALTVFMALVLAVAGGAAAQQTPSSPPETSQAAPAPSQAPAESKNTNVEVNVGGSAKPSTEAPSATPAAPSQSEGKLPEAKNGNRTDSSDNVAASPRSGGAERSAIFGLSPISAVVIAAALLVVVILAIVAMTRSNDTYIDTNRGV
jgi:glucose/arabinose dehydrogenase